jgi:hypothetical protein
MEKDLEKAKNLKLISPSFEQLLGIKVIILFQRTQNDAALYVDFFVATKESFILVIWSFQNTIRNLIMLNRNLQG